MIVAIDRKWLRRGYTAGNVYIDGMLMCTSLEGDGSELLPCGIYSLLVDSRAAGDDVFQICDTADRQIVGTLSVYDGVVPSAGDIVLGDNRVHDRLSPDSDAVFDIVCEHIYTAVECGEEIIVSISGDY